MQNKNFIDKLSSQILEGRIISPFLFLNENLALLNEEIEKIARTLCEKFEIPYLNIFILEDNGEKIKISEIKEFLSKTNLRNSYKFQIFLIKNVSRMTLQSANSCLKIFEEPGFGNIIFLTNKSESLVLDTILSRVNIKKISINNTKNINFKFYDLIDNYVKYNKLELFSYFFSSKLEKQEYLDFLKALLDYGKKNYVFLDFLEELLNDISSIEQNSVNARYIVDKYILKIK